MSFKLDNGKVIESIDSKNIDFTQWGMNCKNLNLTVQQTEKVLEPYMDTISIDNFDDFWLSYHRTDIDDNSEGNPNDDRF